MSLVGVPESVPLDMCAGRGLDISARASRYSSIEHQEETRPAHAVFSGNNVLRLGCGPYATWITHYGSPA